MAKTMASKGARRTHSARDSEAAWIAMLLNHPVLSHEETIELITRSQAGCRQSLDRLVRHNMRLIVSIAKRFQGKHDLQLSDLISEGAVGLIHSIKEFDVSLGLKLSTYGTWWIRQSMSRTVDNQGRHIRMPVHMAQLLRKINRAKWKILARTGNDNPDPEEILMELGMDVTGTNIKIIQRITGSEAVTPASLNAELHLDSGMSTTLQDMLPDSEDDPEGEAHRHERIDAMCQALGTVTARELSVVIRHVVDERTLEDISQDPEFGVTRERIRQIEAKALKKIRIALEAIPE